MNPLEIGNGLYFKGSTRGQLESFSSKDISLQVLSLVGLGKVRSHTQHKNKQPDTLSRLEAFPHA